MSREIVNAICRTFPSAEVADPWGGGHDAWKVGGKMFACIGATMPGVSVKTDSVETAQMLIDAGARAKARDLPLHRRHHAGRLCQDRQRRDCANADRCRSWREGALPSPLMGQPALGHT